MVYRLYIRDISHKVLLLKLMSWPKFNYPQCCFISYIFETDRNIPGLVVLEETGFTADKGKETRLKRISYVRSNRVYSGAGV